RRTNRSAYRTLDSRIWAKRARLSTRCLRRWTTRLRRTCSEMREEGLRRWRQTWRSSMSRLLPY
ncbi:hypothetical protein LTR04_003847, partial [Oleoguttula sp. CCFEE 6159]